MKTQILKSFLLFCTLYLTFNLYSNAQIVYTDVIPDQTFSINNSFYLLDLNNDSITDYEITILTGLGTLPFANIRLMASAGNSVSVTSSNASAFNYGASIGPSNLWWTASYYTLARDGWNINGHTGLSIHVKTGNWVNKYDKYLGLKFISNGNTYFGWARLDAQVNSNGTGNFTIKDYAYNAAPNQSILAGDTGSASTGIIYNRIQSGHALIYPNPAASYFTISLPATAKNVEVIITDINGKIIYTAISGETQKIVVNSKDFEEGTFYIHIQTSEFIETRKLIVAK